MDQRHARAQSGGVATYPCSSGSGAGDGGPRQRRAANLVRGEVTEVSEKVSVVARGRQRRRDATHSSAIFVFTADVRCVGQHTAHDALPNIPWDGSDQVEQVR